VLSIGIYHGDEEWVLKGIGQDLAKALRSFEGINVTTTDQVFKGERLASDVHVFVQQGQLNANCCSDPSNVPDNSVCLFTHLDVGNFRPDILAKCKAVVFNSSLQLSMAIANGFDPSNSILQPHAVDPLFHRILDNSHPTIIELRKIFSEAGKSIDLKSTVGFCGRYWNKSTYTRRKNYALVKEVVLSLADDGIPVLVLGPGWNELFTEKHSKISLITADYKDYPAIYNMMKIFVSLSIHEGGPLPVLESMCCGAYPIVTNTGFAFDVIRPIVDGTLVDPFRSCDYYSMLIKQKFLSDSWDPYAMRERASLYSFKALASKILGIF